LKLEEVYCRQSKVAGLAASVVSRTKWEGHDRQRKTGKTGCLYKMSRMKEKVAGKEDRGALKK